MAVAPVTQALLTLPQLLPRPEGQKKRVQMGVGRVRAPQGTKLLLLCLIALLTRVHGMPSWSLDSISVHCSLGVPDSFPIYSSRSTTSFQSLPQQRNLPMPN